MFFDSNYIEKKKSFQLTINKKKNNDIHTQHKIKNKGLKTDLKSPPPPLL